MRIGFCHLFDGPTLFFLFDFGPGYISVSKRCLVALCFNNRTVLSNCFTLFICSCNFLFNVLFFLCSTLSSSSACCVLRRSCSMDISSWSSSNVFSVALSSSTRVHFPPTCFHTTPSSCKKPSAAVAHEDQLCHPTSAAPQLLRVAHESAAAHAHHIWAGAQSQFLPSHASRLTRSRRRRRWRRAPPPPRASGGA